MSVLRTFETKLAGLVEGAFSRVFRSEVRPVEIARKLSKEMDKHRTISISRTYVPNEYIVYLASADRERFRPVEEGLARELSTYLLEHARAEKMDLLSRPIVTFETAAELKLGEFGIQARMVEAVSEASPVQEGAQQADFGQTMVYSSAERIQEPLREIATQAPPAVLAFEGKRVPLEGSESVLGRSRDCAIVVNDPNVSRHHASISASDEGWVLSDLGSTNGVLVNGQRMNESVLLVDRDLIELGSTEITFLLK